MSLDWRERVVQNRERAESLSRWINNICDRVEESYGCTVMQQVRGRRHDFRASAITPLVLTAFAYPPRLRKMYLRTVFDWEAGRGVHHFVHAVGSLIIQSKKRQRVGSCGQINKKRGNAERETDRRRNKEKRA